MFFIVVSRGFGPEPAFSIRQTSFNLKLEIFVLYHRITLRLDPIGQKVCFEVFPLGI